METPITSKRDASQAPINPNLNIPTGTDIIRKVVFEIGESFTIGEIVETIQSQYEQEIDDMHVYAYLDQISGFGLVERHGNIYRKNTPKF